MANTGLSEFKAVLSDFQQLGSLALKGAVVAPLTDIWLKLGPPPANARSPLLFPCSEEKHAALSQDLLGFISGQLG